MSEEIEQLNVVLDNANFLLSKNMEIHDKRKIAKLEKEIEELKEQLENKIDLYEDTISYQLGFDKGKEYMQQRIDKAIEYIKISKDFLEENNIEKQFVKDLLEILGDKENE